jgi:hypothetical protein
VSNKGEENEATSCSKGELVANAAGGVIVDCPGLTKALAYLHEGNTFVVNHKNVFAPTAPRHGLAPKQPRYLGTPDRATWLRQNHKHWEVEVTEPKHHSCK